MPPQANDTGLGRDALGASEISYLHVDIRHPAVLASEMFEDLNGKTAIMFDVLCVDHGDTPSRLGNPLQGRAKARNRRYRSATGN